MKIVKKTNRYCPTCKKHTEHKIIQVKSKPRPKTKKRALKIGVRRHFKKISGYHGSTSPKVKPVKTSKKLNLIFQCSVCKKKHYKQHQIRAKKVKQEQGV